MASEATSLTADEQLTSALEPGEHTFLSEGYPDEAAQVVAKKTYTETSVLELSHFRISVTGAPVTTFGHQRALLNRMPASRLAPGAKYDASTYKPTFVHDTLALPGSLAQLLLGKGSAEDIIPRMTPGILPGVHAHIDLDTKQPVLVQSPRPEDFVQGMLVFGLGKEARDVLRAYYGRFAHRHRFPVELEVRVGEDGRYHLERRAIWAYVWLKSSKIDDCEVSSHDNGCPKWDLEQFLGGKLGARLPLRIEQCARGDEDEDGYIGREIVEHESEPEEDEPEREVVHGGPGLLDYQRASYFTGW
ncbi:hypothetical protein CB0940_03070 [Cercospora beticola]|uniref:Uncharacterized protein n=1 Tax=Cercospora beticola TaxID=122368 RepID=A0A2G5I1K4_CERBT|nr:hypothetical protein CB0940_03070 [Cercospora beticola]PIA98638.1 hypothetical protein CB0940_03070 [Cercospora beticola]WPB00236.1 hypothetical protein RHO25_004855 [Cercospora beticola]CAK1361569.1 unnamed protein product [Cercospora beticola]